MYDTQGNITREGAEKVIREGGSVIINKRLYSRIESLPDEAEFAAGNPQAEAGARARLEKQIADAQVQLSRLGPKGAGETETKAGTTTVITADGTKTRDTHKSKSASA